MIPQLTHLSFLVLFEIQQGATTYPQLVAALRQGRNLGNRDRQTHAIMAAILEQLVQGQFVNEDAQGALSVSSKGDDAMRQVVAFYRSLIQEAKP